MRRLPRVVGAAIVICAVSYPLAAQNDPCTSRTMLVTVIDRDGNPVRGFAAANFRGKFRGKSVQIRSAAFDSGHRRMVIVLDASGSMVERGLSDVTTSVVADAILHNRGSFSLALVIFASEVLETISFKDGYFSVAKRISNLKKQMEVAPRGHRKTALFDALAAALGILKPTQQGDVIYAVTDGGDNKSQLKTSQIERLLISENVRFFCTIPLINGDRPKTPEQAEGPLSLERLVKSTGGGTARLFTLNKITDLFWWGRQNKAAVLRSLRPLYEQMSFNYRLDVRLPIPPDKPRKWELDIIDGQGERRSDLTVLYPQKLLPCSSATVVHSAPDLAVAPK